MLDVYTFYDLHYCWECRTLKNVQSDIIILHQYISVTLMTFIKVTYDKNTINVQITVQKSMIKLFSVTFDLQITCYIRFTNQV